MNTLLASYGPPSAGKQIGVVTIAGTIVDGEAGPGTAAGDTISGLIYDAIDNKDLQALVVRVDSPGGSVTASEKIRLAIEAAKARGCKRGMMLPVSAPFHCPLMQPAADAMKAAGVPLVFVQAGMRD